MGRNTEALTEKQVAVLEWVRDGCPGSDGDFGRRITARALHRRGLIGIKGQGASWSATITASGAAWLEAHPKTEGGADGVEDLIRRVVAADGPVVIGSDVGDKVAHEKLVELANRSPNRPRGWRVKVYDAGTWGHSRYEVVLERYFEDLVEPAPVAVPTRVAKYHVTVKAYLADRDRQMVSRDHLDRAARILQAIADEAPRRGLQVLSPDQAAAGLPSYDAKEVRRGHFVLRSPAGLYAVRVHELSGKSDKRVMPRRWDQHRTRAAWLDRLTYEFVSTGQLELIVEGPGMSYSGSRWRDTATITLEERLPRLFRAIEVHRLTAEWREEQRKKEAAERRCRWEAAIAEAKAKYAEQARWEAFVRSSQEWRAADMYRAFLAAAREAVCLYSGPERAELVAHLDFAQRRLDELDPVLHPERIPPRVPDPKPDDLQPYLPGVSPYGPDALR